MTIRVRDTLSGGPVEVGENGKVGIYVCGPTVYNHIHIGNSRVHLFWDVAVRYLRSRGYEVKFVWNITDIEDKIIEKANAEGVSWRDIVERYTTSFRDRLNDLEVGEPDAEPRATEYIPEMIEIIRELIENDHAYAADNGDVYYAVESYADYGALSNQRPSEMRETEKGETGYKRSHLDFTLWKASKGAPGEPSWESPWGDGRPGWHIECSAMVSEHFPDGVDIHGGGTDIRFPHHENELAQSKGAHPEAEFVRAWCHHGMVRMKTDVADEKMAKSVGNVVDIKEAVEEFGADAIRMWLLQSHYGGPVDFSGEILAEKRRSWERLLRFYAQISFSKISSQDSARLASELLERFDSAMREDFNTPEAIAAVFEAVGEAGRAIAQNPEAAGEFASLADAIEEVLEILGFDLSQVPKIERVEGFIYSEISPIRVQLPAGVELDEHLKDLISRRESARREKDWPTADRLRDELRDEGWVVEDTPEGPVLELG